MDHHDLMEAFSRCRLGVILADADDNVQDINAAGERLLQRGETPRGMPLREVAPFLLEKEGEAGFANPAFDRYLLPCPSPKLPDLPGGARLLVFRDATKDFRHDILEKIFNNVSEAIAVWDGESRILMLNAAASRLEAQLFEDISGKHITSLYEAGKDSMLAIPLVIDNKKPVHNLRQNYLTHFGKELQIVSNSYPVLKDEQLIAAVCTMEDWSKTEELNKRVIELQRMLVGRAKPKKDGALPAKYVFDDILHSGDAMRDTVRKCKRVAESDSFVMLCVETGTGKELFAQSIHNASRRADRPFIAINCAAIPDSLLEAMLFGTEKGAYTGSERREGLFEQADTGTLLLDEINSMNVTLQSKLLRVLQDGIFRRVGGTRNIQVDVRVLSNINVSPQHAVEQKLLRQDLYHRLGVVSITIPPLRERRQDIELLARTFLAARSKKWLKNVSGIDPEVLHLFYLYPWPGNVRELEHAIEYAMNMIPDGTDTITPEHIPDHILLAVNGPAAPAAPKGEAPTMESVMEEAGRRFLRKALSSNEWNISQTAKALGLTRQNLQHRMRRLGVKHETS